MTASTGQRSRNVRERLEGRRVMGELGCWLWPGAQSNGYGTMMVEGRTRYVHVLAFEAYVGPVPEGHQVDHVKERCQNKTCYNPEHLEPVTQRENMARSGVRWAEFARGRCHRGHDVSDPENVYTRPDTGARQCRFCIRERRLGARARRG